MFNKSILDRFWSKVDKKGSGGCWVWIAGRTGDGYGAFYLNGRTLVASRVAWMIGKGKIPDGKLVCHHCDNPPCVNLNHLFLGANWENSRDREIKRRRINAILDLIEVHPYETGSIGSINTL